VAKLLPLVLFVAGGLFFIGLHGSPVPVNAESHPTGTWLRTVLLLIYAFTGFEAALIPTG
jgi:amino acid transporter